jgi:hypothetical protein
MEGSIKRKTKQRQKNPQKYHEFEDTKGVIKIRKS